MRVLCRQQRDSHRICCNAGFGEFVDAETQLRMAVLQNDKQFERRYQDLFDEETGLVGDLLLRDRLTVGLARARRFNRYVRAPVARR